MLFTTQRQVVSQVSHHSRSFTVVVPRYNLPSTSTTTSRVGQLTYFVPRNTKGNLPVYTDVRSAGGRYMVLLRNIEGNAAALAQDLSRSLFEKESYEASQLKVQISQSKHLIISGGRWKNDVLQWLKGRGF